MLYKKERGDDDIFRGGFRVIKGVKFVKVIEREVCLIGGVVIKVVCMVKNVCDFKVKVKCVVCVDVYDDDDARV